MWECVCCARVCVSVYVCVCGGVWAACVRVEIRVQLSAYCVWVAMCIRYGLLRVFYMYGSLYRHAFLCDTVSGLCCNVLCLYMSSMDKHTSVTTSDPLYIYVI